MSRVSDYRAELRSLSDWEPYLLSQSGLPGPRGNLELAHAVAEEGTEEQFRRWSALSPDVAPENTPEAFLAFCGVMGLGALLGRRGEASSAGAGTPEWPTHGGAAQGGDSPPLQILRALASDPRWRIREAVATGLQLWGDSDMPALLQEMVEWVGDGYYEQRAAAAALCEPRLLKDPGQAATVLELLDRITQGIASAPPADRKSEPFRTLRQGLGYCWSVAVAAHPAEGVPLMQRWLAHPDLDVRWIMRENLTKKRIASLNISSPE